jgi:diguanylate cyclase (GGDEF)-like protein
MLFFDIDHFKIFNDRYSYAIGDKVLQNVAKVAQSSVRNVDLVGRYGGEEFVALIPEVSKESAVLVAERLRLRVETLRLATDYGELGITISVGVASITFTKYQTKPLDIDEEEELEKLIHRAGKMLRQAKESGRNRVCVEQDQGDGDWTLK